MVPRGPSRDPSQATPRDSLPDSMISEPRAPSSYVSSVTFVTLLLDEYDRYCILAVVDEPIDLKGSYLKWWNMHEIEFLRLV
jgi:hypothetical protein